MSPYLLYVLTRHIEPTDDRVWLDAHKATARVYFNMRPFHRDAPQWER